MSKVSRVLFCRLFSICFPSYILFFLLSLCFIVSVLVRSSSCSGGCLFLLLRPYWLPISASFSVFSFLNPYRTSSHRQPIPLNSRNKSCRRCCHHHRHRTSILAEYHRAGRSRIGSDRSRALASATCALIGQIWRAYFQKNSSTTLRSSGGCCCGDNNSVSSNKERR